VPRPKGSFVLALLAAGALSFLAGYAFSLLAALVPCRGESLACNIDQAVGGYMVVIWAILGPLIFGLVLAIARNRTALLGALAVLLVPIVALFLINEIEHALYVGLEPQRQFRTLLVTFAPSALTLLMQYLILRLVVPRMQELRT
jgi:hypothetical protein